MDNLIKDNLYDVIKNDISSWTRVWEKHQNAYYGKYKGKTFRVTFGWFYTYVRVFDDLNREELSFKDFMFKKGSLFNTVAYKALKEEERAAKYEAESRERFLQELAKL